MVCGDPWGRGGTPHTSVVRSIVDSMSKRITGEFFPSSMGEGNARAESRDVAVSGVEGTVNQE